MNPELTEVHEKTLIYFKRIRISPLLILWVCWKGLQKMQVKGLRVMKRDFSHPASAKAEGAHSIFISGFQEPHIFHKSKQSISQH